MYDLKGNFIKSFKSAAEAARELNTNRTHITACCKKRQKKCRPVSVDLYLIFLSIYSTLTKTKIIV